jgi:hypothetical protein
MQDEQFEDLKRFVANTVSQSVSASEERLTKQLGDLTKEMRDGFAGVGDALEVHTKDTDRQLADHEQRITTLEQAA